MNRSQTIFLSRTGKRPEKSAYLTLNQISERIAQALVTQRRQTAIAHSSRVYATDQDEFLDIVGQQSVNENPSQPTGNHT